jgi:transcriptional regulator with XRE-family HTH domain
MAIDSQTLGLALKEVRGVRGMTQSEVAERAGVTAQYLSLIETGRKLPGTETINLIADALGIPGQWLVFLGGGCPPAQSGSEQFEKLDLATKKAIMAAIRADSEFKART